MSTTNTDASTKKFQINVSKDSMMVSIIVKKPASGEFPPSFDEIMTGLFEEGIIFGIHEDKIKQILDDSDFNNPICIAEGLKPKRGNNSEIEYKFNTIQDHKPQEDEDGRIDYKNINFIQNIEAGGVLATRTPAQPGIPGKDVYGHEIKGPDGRDLPFKNGSNTTVSSDGNTLTATVSGAIVFLYNKISVNDVMLIKGDVDFNVGNIDCRGSIKVSGTVKTGFSIKTDGDLEVNGNVEDANLDVAGNIMIKGGFFGKGEGVMKAGGEVYVKFAEGQKIIAGGDVVLGGEAINCNIETQGNVIVKGPKGKIVGGITRAKKEIISSYLGSESGTLTELSVAYDPTLIKQYHACVKEHDRILADGLRIKDTLLTLVRLKLDNKITPEQEEVLNKLKQFNDELPQNLKKLEEEKEAIHEELKKLDDAQIIAEKMLYSGVKASFGIVYREIMDESERCVIKLDNGKILISEYHPK